MMKLFKTEIPISINDYCEKRKDADKKGYRWTNDIMGYMIFEEKKSCTPVEGKETKEYKEFIEFYRKYVNKKSSYAKTTPRKYEKARNDKNPKTGKKFTHKELMDVTRQYSEHLKAFKGYPVGVEVFLNRRRYIEEFEIVKVDYSEKWITDIMNDRNIEKEYQERIMKYVRIWRKTHGTEREFTSQNLEIMITKYYINKET